MPRSTGPNIIETLHRTRIRPSTTEWRADGPSDEDEARLVSSAFERIEGSDGPDDHPRTIDLLGFTHYSALSFKSQYWEIRLKTAHDRFSRAVRRIDHWYRDNRHLSLAEQQHKLSQKLRGHYAYFGVSGNSEALGRFRHERRWRKRLNRRNRIRTMKPAKFRDLLQRYPLVPARAFRSQFRLAAKP